MSILDEITEDWQFYGLPPTLAKLQAARAELDALAAEVAEARKETGAQTRVPAINQPWPEQGGIYIGSRLIDGKVHHVVIPGGVEFDHVDVSFDQVEKVVNEGGELNGFRDWRAPDQEDLMLAYINARERFMQKGKDSIYWSRSEHHDWPWAVYFENGSTNTSNRDSEFRVRPFRLIALEP